MNTLRKMWIKLKRSLTPRSILPTTVHISTTVYPATNDKPIHKRCRPYNSFERIGHIYLDDTHIEKDISLDDEVAYVHGGVEPFRRHYNPYEHLWLRVKYPLVMLLFINNIKDNIKF
jgi:hypothetical protein